MSRSKPYKMYKSCCVLLPFCLSEHANRTSRRLCLIGDTFALILPTAALVHRDGGQAVLARAQGCEFAWVAHFFFEHNRSATLKDPFFSLIRD